MGGGVLHEPQHDSWCDDTSWRPAQSQSMTHEEMSDQEPAGITRPQSTHDQGME